MTNWCDRTVTGGILFLILFTPFAFGSVHPWAFSIMEALLFLLVIVWMVKIINQRSEVGGQKSDSNFAVRNPQSAIYTYALPLALFLLFALFQLLPLPPALLRVLSPQTFELYTQSLPGWPAGGADIAKGEGQSEKRVSGFGFMVQGSGLPNAQHPSPETRNATNASPNTRHLTPNTSRPAPIILPTVDEVRRGVPVPSFGAQSAGSEEQSAKGKATEVGDRRSVGAKDFSPVLRGQRSETPNATNATNPAPPWLPLSVAPSLTRTDLLKFAAYAALFFLVLCYPFGDRRSQQTSRSAGGNPKSAEQRFFRSVLLVVLASGLLVAATGFLQRFAWNGKILWFFVPYDWGGASLAANPRSSGPFVNPDHFANYLALIFPLAVAGALFHVSMARKEFEAGFRIVSAFIAFLLFTGILLSLSRAAWIGALLGVVILMAFKGEGLGSWVSGSGFRVSGLAKSEGQRAKRVSGLGSWVPGFGSRKSEIPNPTPDTRHLKPETHNAMNAKNATLALIVLCFLLIVTLFFVGPAGREQVDTRLGDTVSRDAGLWGRAGLWQDTLSMVRDFPLFGVGLGAWPELFPHYRQAPWSPEFYREAHNDYVEVLAETGLIGFGLLAWFFLLAGRAVYRGVKAAAPNTLPLLAAILAALGVMAFHELFDFSLQIPANAFLFTLLFALGLRMALTRNLIPNTRHPRFASWVQGFGSWVLGLGFQVSGFRFRKSEIPNPKSEARHPTPDTQYPRPGTQNPQTATQYLAPLALCTLSLFLFVSALRQEQIPYPYNIEQPRSPAKARATALAHPARASSHVALLRLRQNELSLDDQLTETRAALWLEPTNPHVRDLYAGLLFKAGKTQESLSEIARSVADAPAFASHFYLSGRLLPWLSAAEKTAVENGFKQALARSYPGAGENLAAFYGRLGRFADQAGLYEKTALAEKDREASFDLLLKAGSAYASSQDSANAERLFRKVIAAAPGDERAYGELATLVYGPRKELASAKKIVAEGVGNGAPAFYLYLALARAAVLAGSPDEARAALGEAKDDLEKSAADGEESYSRLLLLAESAGMAGDKKQEELALSEALRFKPRASNTLLRLATLHMQEKDFDRAAYYYTELTGINPNSADVYHRLAQAEEARYRFAAAERAYARAVALAPDNDGYRQRYEALKAKVERNRIAR